MIQTVIGIFDSDNQAKAAVEQLISNNFKREYIDVLFKDEHGGRGDITDEHNTLGHRIGNYFKNIFDDTDDALRYAAVAQQGAIVAVQTEDLSRAEIAADILDACGAVNVNERARILEDSWTRDERTYAASASSKSTTRLSDLRDASHSTDSKRDVHIENLKTTENRRSQSCIVGRPVYHKLRFNEGSDKE